MSVKARPRPDGPPCRLTEHLPSKEALRKLKKCLGKIASSFLPSALDPGAERDIAGAGHPVQRCPRQREAPRLRLRRQVQQGGNSIEKKLARVLA